MAARTHGGVKGSSPVYVTWNLIEYLPPKVHTYRTMIQPHLQAADRKTRQPSNDAWMPAGKGIIDVYLLVLISTYLSLG